MSFVSVSSLTTAIQAYNVCPVLPLSQELPVTDPVDGVSQVTRHAVPLSPDGYRDKSVPYQVSLYIRSADCSMLQASTEDACDSCSKVLASEVKRQNQSTMKKSKPVKDKAPLASCSKEQLIVTVQQQRIQCKELRGKLSAMEKDISYNSITVNEALEKDILDIMGSTDLKQTPHMELFWRQQKKLLASQSLADDITPT